MIGAEVGHGRAVGQAFALAGRPEVDRGAAKVQQDGRHATRLTAVGDLGAKLLGEPTLAGSKVRAEDVDVVKLVVERRGHQ